MLLESLHLANFKNCEQAGIHCNPGLNLVYGRNGSGKTNLLDAIHFCCLTKSYFSVSDRQLIRDGSDFYRVVSKFNTSKSEVELVYKYRSGGTKEVLVNQEKLEPITDIIGRFPVVFVAPNDIQLVHDASMVRRRFVDRVLCQSDRLYMENLIKYNRILRQKNTLLKSKLNPNVTLLSSYNDSLIRFGKEIHMARTSFIKSFSTTLYSVYDEISKGLEAVDIFYESQLNDGNIEDLFVSSMGDEIRRQRPLVGIQRDDLIFTIGKKPLKKFGSQGQIKTYLYALKLAEFRYLKEIMEDTPILILDDFFEKLDSIRLSNLLDLLSNDQFKQVFLSDTELERSQAILERLNLDFDAFKVEDGTVQKI